MTPEKRKPLTKLEFARLAVEQEGRCGCGCGQKLDFKARQIWDEHLVPLFSLGSNDLENRALYRAECAKAKTATETTGRAKVRRFTGQTTTQPERREARGRSLIQSKKKIDQPKDPWNSEFRKKIKAEQAR